MKQVTIPNTDLKPSELCLGGNRFGTVIEQKDAFTLLDAFADLGGNFLDTALVYADWIPGAPKSASEKTIGQWLKSKGNRDQFVVATKGGHPDFNEQLPRLSKGDLIHDINKSLANLQTDVIDMYWLHRDAANVSVGSIIEALNEQVQAGKIRYFGCSNWRVDRIVAANDYAEQKGLQGFSANQPWWSLIQPNLAALSDPENLVVFGTEEAVLHQKTRLAIIPYSSQGQGFFSRLEAGGESGLSDKDRANFFNETNRLRWPRAKKLAENYGVPVSHIVLGYLRAQHFVTIPVIGCRSLEQLRDSVTATELALTQEDIVFLTAVTNIT